MADHPAPVLARPEVLGVSPHADAGSFEGLLQLVDAVGVLPRIGDEGVAYGFIHGRKSMGKRSPDVCRD